jgi:hypothetical protein
MNGKRTGDNEECPPYPKQNCTRRQQGIGDIINLSVLMKITAPLYILASQ